MLRRSRTAIDPALRSIYTSSHAIIFLGTPHRGGSYVNLGLTARKIVACSGFDANDKLLRDLKFDSSTAKLLREEFAKMLEEIKPTIYTFQEGLGLSGFGPLSGKVGELADLKHRPMRIDLLTCGLVGGRGHIIYIRLFS